MICPVAKEQQITEPETERRALVRKWLFIYMNRAERLVRLFQLGSPPMCIWNREMRLITEAIAKLDELLYKEKQ